MKSIVKTVVVVAVFFGISFQAKSQNRLKFEKDTYDMGTIVAGRDTIDVKIINTSDDVIFLNEYSFHRSAGYIRIRLVYNYRLDGPYIMLKPNETGTIRVGVWEGLITERFTPFVSITRYQLGRPNSNSDKRARPYLPGNYVEDNPRPRFTLKGEVIAKE